VAFPLTQFDDQVDAMTQFLHWISAHPNPKVRPARTVAAGFNSRGPLGRTSSGYPGLRPGAGIMHQELGRRQLGLHVMHRRCR
jgi:hypothetical protein